jgi:hypothetical protein
MIDVTILKTAGLDIVAKWQRLPMKRTERTDNLGADDVALMRKLVLAGDEHAKAMRMVVAWMLVRAPRYWWQQFDTYRVGVEKLSESTMHTLMRDGIWPKDFTRETPVEAVSVVRKYVRSGHFEIAKASLPEGYLQTRLVMASYQALRRMWLQRRSHRLAEWCEFLVALEELPLAEKLIFAEERA